MAQHREKLASQGLPGDELIGKLQKGWTGLRKYEAPTTGQPLSWWERRKQRKAMEKAAADLLKPNIIHTPPRGPQPR